MRRYIHKTNVSNQRNGFLIWKKGVLKQIESDNNLHSLRSMARIVVSISKRRRAMQSRIWKATVVYRHGVLFDLIPILLSSIESYLSNQRPNQCILKKIK